MEYYIIEFIMYLCIGFLIGLFLLRLIKPFNYTKTLVNDIKTDLNIDISKNK